MYKVGLALPALVFSVFFLPCPFSFFPFLLAYFFSPSSLKLAVVSHLFKINQLKVNFGLLRDLSFFGSGYGRCYVFLVFLSYFLTYIKLIQLHVKSYGSWRQSLFTAHAGWPSKEGSRGRQNRLQFHTFYFLACEGRNEEREKRRKRERQALTHSGP